MKVSSIRLLNYRSFADSGVVHFGNVNVLIGANNTGKSSVLRGLYLLQANHGFQGDVRAGNNESLVDIHLTGAASSGAFHPPAPGDEINIQLRLATADRRSGSMGYAFIVNGQSQRTGNNPPIQAADPNHFIVPYFSKRKTTQYSEDVKEANVRIVGPDVTYLAAKLSRLGNPSFPAHQEYSQACESILGFVVTAIPSVNGQQPGIYLDDTSSMPIDQMGEGVPNIVYLLASLSVSNGKLFLIEELENDLHPTALKALLDFIIRSSEKNQFIISTHSNIVVSHLGAAAGSHIFRVTSRAGTLPTEARIERIPDTAESRIAVLHELGYAFSDFALWDGWLILEESSAERIIRDYLIPWFVPFLSRVRTIAAGGASKVEPSFDDFHRMMLFTHLQPAYKGRAWVRLDGDEEGKEIEAKLRAKYPSVEPDHFGTFPQPQFELFYPTEFQPEVERILAIPDKQAKREAKKGLLIQVMQWLDADPGRGKKALGESASAIVADLEVIESQFVSMNRA